MVIIVKRLVPVYKANATVPKKYRNLKKAVHVTSFKNLYPNIPDILVKKYDLMPDEKIVVFWTKYKSLPYYRNYRLPFKKVYSGPLSKLGNYMERVRRGMQSSTVFSSETNPCVNKTRPHRVFVS